MLDPRDLYSYEADAVPGDHPSGPEPRATVMLLALGGFVDAGATQRLISDHILREHTSRVIASFDVDQLVDYRGRRPTMTFDKDRFTSYDDPALLLHRVTDRDGTPFLLLAGPEPDYQWERMSAAVLGLVDELGVDLTVTVHGIPMAVPHTRAIGMTAHANDRRLIGEQYPLFGAVQVPASLTALIQLRLGEHGKDGIGYAVHVPHYLASAAFPDAALAGLAAISGATGLSLHNEGLEAAAVDSRAQLASEVEGNDEVLRVVAALEEQYDTFMAARTRPSLLATDVSDLPTADQIGAEFEAFLRDVDSGGNA